MSPPWASASPRDIVAPRRSQRKISIMARLSCSAVFAVAFLAASCLAAAQKPDNTTQVCRDPTSKSDAKDDNFFDVCLDGATFTDRKGEFNFNSAYIKKTTFTDVVFEKGTDFAFAFWEGVTFTNCVFKGENKFDQALMEKVTFEDCTFEDRALFTQNTLGGCTFSNTKFEDGATFDLVDISNTTFSDCTFEGEETLFDRAGVKDMTFEKVKFDEVRFSFLESTGITFTGCEIGALNCHEKLDDGEFAKRRAEFDDLTITGSTIGKIACDQSVFRGTTIKSTKLKKGTHDFSKSTFTEINLNGVEGDGCAEVDFTESTMKTGEFKDNDICKLILKETELGQVKGLALDSDKVEIEGAVLPGTRVGDKCCVDFCKKNKCMCDIKTDPTDGCSKGTSKTNPNLDPADDPKCFPGFATVELEDGSVIPMSELAIGDSVKVGVNQFSKVFMFTHKMHDVASEYVELSTASGARLVLTSGHFLYADGSLVASGRVAPGAQLSLGDGATSIVTGVRRLSGEWGLFNPQTLQGDIVVDGIISSTYTTAVQPSFAHAVLTPVRALFGRFGVSTSSFENGADSILGALPSTA